MGLSAMLAEEYISSAYRYSAAVRATNKTQQKNITSTTVFQSASVRGEVTQNISTAENPGPKSYDEDKDCDLWIMRINGKDLRLFVKSGLAPLWGK